MNAGFDYLRLNTSKISDYGFVVADELELIPRGTFAGTIYELDFVRNGSVARIFIGPRTQRGNLG
jgi:hypothetical protein